MLQTVEKRKLNEIQILHMASITVPKLRHLITRAQPHSQNRSEHSSSLSERKSLTYSISGKLQDHYKSQLFDNFKPWRIKILASENSWDTSEFTKREGFVWFKASEKIRRCNQRWMIQTCAMQGTPESQLERAAKYESCTAAADTRRQMPRRYEAMEKQGIVCDIYMHTRKTLQ